MKPYEIQKAAMLLKEHEKLRLKCETAVKAHKTRPNPRIELSWSRDTVVSFEGDEWVRGFIAQIDVRLKELDQELKDLGVEREIE